MPNILSSFNRDIMVLVVERVVKQQAYKQSDECRLTQCVTRSKPRVYRSSVTCLMFDIPGCHVWSNAPVSKPSALAGAVTRLFLPDSLSATLVLPLLNFFFHPFVLWQIHFCWRRANVVWEDSPRAKESTACFSLGRFSTSVFVVPQIVEWLSTPLFTVDCFYIAACQNQ